MDVRLGFLWSPMSDRKLLRRPKASASRRLIFPQPRRPVAQRKADPQGIDNLQADGRIALMRHGHEIQRVQAEQPCCALAEQDFR
jgi:hypothetical protein